MKSPIIAAATAPLSRVDAVALQEGNKAQAAWAEKKSQRKRGDPDIGPEPKTRRHVVEAFTMEALVGVLADNPHGVLVRQDELTQLLGSFDAYKANKGGDRPMMLSLFDGRETRVSRVSRQVYVPCWGASVIGGIQPAKIKEMASNLDADGLLQRFIPVLGNGERKSGVDRPPDTRAKHEYEEAVRSLAETAFFAPEPVRLSVEAYQTWGGLAEKLNVLRDLPGVSEAWKGHLGKWPGFSNRLLLICHVLENWQGSGLNVDSTPVSAQTASKTVRLCEWLLGNSIRFYSECVGPGEAGNDAVWIAGHILANTVQTRITRRDIGQAKHDLREDPARVGRAMNYLDRMGWCTPDLGERVDRHGVTRWAVNPLVHDRFRDRAEREREHRALVRKRIAEAAAQGRLMTEGSS